MSVFSLLTDEDKNELWSMLALRHAAGVGPRRARKLLDSYGSAFAAVEEALRAPSRWSDKGLLPRSLAERFATGEWRKDAKAEWDAIRTGNHSFLLWTAPDYPALLREIPDAPLLLYCKGNASLLRGPAVAVVGARDCTREGVAVAAFFARDFAGAGVAVISGMAKGIDRAAHLAALEGPGRSIAVLGCGIDVAYPPCNTDVYGLLAREGLLVSEFAPGTHPSSRHFPIRNRLISGLSQGVLVVEAAGRSGSLITARLALEQNRDVFAVPGHAMASASKGCRELVRRGAKPVFSADDVLLDLAPLLTLEARKALEARRRRCSKARPTGERAEESPAGLAAGSGDAPPKGASLRKAAAVGGKQQNVSLRLMPDAGNAPQRIQAGRTSASPGNGGATAARQARHDALSPEERRIVSALGDRQLHIDDLSRSLQMDVAQLSGMLIVLEMQGFVRRSPGMIYSLRPL